MVDRVQPVGVSRVAGHEDQFAVDGARGAPFQVMLDLGRLAVFVGPKEADIQIVARVFEIVGVAAEKRDLLFRREDEPHVGVFLITVQVISAAVIERNHVAAQPGGVERFFLDRVHHGPPRVFGRLGSQAGLDRGCHSIGHVPDADQDVQFQVEAFDFLGPGLGLKALLQVIVLGAGKLLQRVGAHVVVGHHQPLGRDERPGAAAVEADRSLLQVVEPGVGRVEVIGLTEQVARRLIEQPHAFVAPRPRATGQTDRHYHCSRDAHHAEIAFRQRIESFHSGVRAGPADDRASNLPQPTNNKNTSSTLKAAMVGQLAT